MELQMTKIFLDDELNFFEKISWDKNPLHRNETYARRTQFGQKVVYGIYATLFGIGYWLNGRNVRFTKIKGDFKKPLFLNEEYDLSLKESNNKVEISFSKSGQVRLKIKITDFEFVESHSNTLKQEIDFIPKKEPTTELNFDRENRLRLENLKYRDGWSSDLIPPSDFILNRSQIPDYQIKTLLWSTYFVGMEIPGRQALYSSFDFQFNATSNQGHDFNIDAVEAILDPRFNQIGISGYSKSCSTTFEINTFKRPDTIEYSMEFIQKAIPSGGELKGKTVFITGASRGFGSVLAMAFALKGADIIINYNRSALEAEHVSQSIKKLGNKVLLIQGDIASESDWLRMASVLKENISTIDILIHNASPLISLSPYASQDSQEFMNFVVQSLKMVHEPNRHLLPLIKTGGSVIQISSIYAIEPVPGFTHYITAKSAAEGYIRALATEYKGINFLISRPPKMLTDQTNTVLIQEEMASPVSIAKIILDSMGSGIKSGNVKIIEN